MAGAGVPSMFSTKSKFKGFKKGPLKRTGPLIDFRHYHNLPKDEQEKTFAGMKSGHHFWH